MELLGAFGFLSSFLIILWMIRREERCRNDPRYLRRVGIVIVNPSALDGAAEVIGYYRGAAIPGSVVFRGMRYEFSRVAPPCYKEIIDRRELYLEPGLVYVTS